MSTFVGKFLTMFDLIDLVTLFWSSFLLCGYFIRIALMMLIWVSLVFAGRCDFVVCLC